MAACQIGGFMGMSLFTTPEELETADSVDREKLESGLEIRTSCCYDMVPYDCIVANCGHGDHEFADIIVWGAAKVKKYYKRDDMPCIAYAPEPALTFHVNCENRRSQNEAIDIAYNSWIQALTPVIERAQYLKNDGYEIQSIINHVEIEFEGFEYFNDMYDKLDLVVQSIL